MKLQWFGHSCFGLTFSDGTRLITDPFDDSVGYPMCTAEADAVLSSHDHFDHNHIESISGNPVMINTEGVHHVGDATITGIHSFHDPEHGALRGENIIFRIEADGLAIVHLGDLGHMPDEAQLASISNADILLIPIGGHFTITTEQAVEIIRQAKPRCAVAMHFSNQYCHFPVTDEKQFVALTQARELPNTIEVTPETVLPATAVMRYE